MHAKILASEIELIQDDIDYLKTRACECLRQMQETKIEEEKKRLWCMFEWYNELYKENKGRTRK